MAKLEKVEVSLNVNARNVNKVQVRQWRKWSERARIVFNNVFENMTTNQWQFLHPKSKAAPGPLWRTTAWNAAWIAADAVDLQA